MKLVIMIPCYNEENQLPITLASIPKSIEGVDNIEILIVDDGSTDRTVEVAKECGVESFAIHSRNFGLSKAFVTGLNKAILLGADIIVNIDADNQYCAEDIEKIIKPILNQEADVVIGARPIFEMSQFKFYKKCLQKIGTFVAKILSGAQVTDATSGFRAFSRMAATSINIFEKYSPLMETTFQCVAKGFILKSVPVRTNCNLRKSRLIKNIFDYIIKCAIIILRCFLIYQPIRCFALISCFCLLLAIILCFKSIIAAIVFFIYSFLAFLFTLLSELFVFNRKLLENMKKNQDINDKTGN